MKTEHFLRITPNLDTLFDDENGMSYPAYDDEIDNEYMKLFPRFKFYVPGIYEWLRRFENATNFSETTTDPSFDWRGWHRDGLLFAKEIFSHLPRNYNLLYLRPYEDKSGVIQSFVDFSTDPINEIIRSLQAGPYNLSEKPAFCEVIDVKVWIEHLFSINLRVNKSNTTFALRELGDFENLRLWMEGVAEDKEDFIEKRMSPGFRFQMMPQRIGQFTQMGRFMVECLCPDDFFTAYVNRKDFIRTLYNALINYFMSDNYPSKEEGKVPLYLPELKDPWVAYNLLRSEIVERYISK